MKILVTGAAGFIGMHLALRLERDGVDVVGVDNFDPYYDVGLKRARADQLARAGVRCVELDLADHAATAALFRDGRYTHVAHLAAQPGVRYSLQNPAAYIRNNIDAFASVLEACRHASVEHLAYASSSSVYGANHTLPYSEDQAVDHPMSLYAATKKADELIAHSYSHLYRLPTTGLRFFTVYGPWGRPDMAAALFARAIVDGTPVKVFNYGRMPPRLHLYRRHRRRRRARAFARAPGLPTPTPRLTRSTTSATILRSIWKRSSASSSDCSASARSANTCRRSRATCRRHSPRSNGSRRRRDSRRRRRSPKGCSASSPGISTTIESTDRRARHDRIRAPGKHPARLQRRWSPHDSGHRRRRFYRLQLRARLARGRPTSRSSISTS